MHTHILTHSGESHLLSCQLAFQEEGLETGHQPQTSYDSFKLCVLGIKEEYKKQKQTFAQYCNKNCVEEIYHVSVLP